MRTNAICPLCGSAVRVARNQLNMIVLINPLADKAGLVWVDGYNIGGEMRVNVVEHRDDIPNSEPLRYFVHDCKAPK